jgi:lipoteichoic acid synthase
MASSFFDTRPISVDLSPTAAPAAPARAEEAVTETSDWRFLRFLFLPLAVYGVVTKSRMLYEFAKVEGPLTIVDGWRSEPAFYLLLFACFGVLLTVARSGCSKKCVCAAALVTGALASWFETAAFFFYEVTGSHIDWVLSHAFVMRLSEMANVASSESDPWMFLHLAIPALAATLALRARPWRQDGSPPVSRLRYAGAYAALAVLAASLLLTPSLTLTRKDLFRNAPMKVAASMWGSFREPVADVQYDAGALAAARLVPGAKRPWRNVVVIMMESTRATATTSYEASLATTPFMTELAKNSLLVEKAYAVLPHTSKATVSILCGVEPHLRLAVTESRPGAIAQPCLAEMLRDHGYKTLYMMPDIKNFMDWHQLVANAGFEDFIALEDMENAEEYEWAHYFGKEDDVSLAPMRKWLEENRDSPFMIGYLTAAPHHDYRAPVRYGHKEFSEDETFDRYLNAVRYQDFFIRNVFALFEELGLYEETVFVLVGDHGQAFMEHGRFGHSNVPYEEGLTVPFLVHAPGAFGDAPRIENVVSQLDVLPTAAAMLGFELEGGPYPGAPVWEAAADRTHFFACWMERECVGSVDARWKHIHHFGDQPDELFDLAADPDEHTNVADAHPELTRTRREAALEWRAHVNAAHENHLGYTGMDRFLEVWAKSPADRDAGGA